MLVLKNQCILFAINTMDRSLETLGKIFEFYDKQKINMSTQIALTDK